MSKKKQQAKRRKGKRGRRVHSPGRIEYLALHGLGACEVCGEPILMALRGGAELEPSDYELRVCAECAALGRVAHNGTIADA
jgi:hypothetical protein